jgi:hypothetical protein
VARAPQIDDPDVMLIRSIGHLADSSSLFCAAANVSYDGGAVTDSARERASATTLFCPEMCLMSVA